MAKKNKENKAEQFRSKGSDILQARPSGIGEFLNDLSPQSVNTHSHSSSYPHINEPRANTRVPGETEPLGRLHLQIRQDLLDKLIDVVFERKRDPKFRKRNATQRSVIEDALESYFRELTPSEK